MTIEEIKVLDIDAIEARAAEIAEEVKTADAEGLDAINAELDAIEERRAAILAEIEERKANVNAVIRGAGKTIEVSEKEKTHMEIRNTEAYINAFANYIKTGNDAECRAALTTENDTTPNGTGTVPVPELVYDIVKTAWEREGITSLVRKSYLKGNLKVGFEISGDDAVIHAEGAAAINPENLVLGVVNLVPQSIKKVVQLSDEIYDLRGSEFLSYVYDELTYRIAKKAADTLIAKIIACGTVSTTTCPGVPAVTATTIGLGTVAAAMGMLSDEAANPVVVMNKATWSAFKAAQYAGSFEVDPFEGLPVVFNNSMTAYNAATTGVAYAIVGDFGHGALMNFPAGEDISFKFDDLSLKKQDLIEVMGRMYVGLGVVAPNAFVKITK